MNLRRASRNVLLVATCGALAACAGVTRAPAQPSVAAMLAAIHAAGHADDSVLAIKPLRARSLTLQLQRARSQALTGHVDAARTTLAQARRAAPNDPEVLQLQAENAIRLHQFARAEQLARASWAAGAKLGPLCARNWQTVVELRRAAHDATGMAQATRGLAQCEKPAIKRY